VRTLLNVTVTKEFLFHLSHNTNALSSGVIILSVVAFVVLWATALTKNDYNKFDLITLVTFVCFATEKIKYNTRTIYFCNLFFSRRWFTLAAEKVNICTIQLGNIFRTLNTFL